MTRSDRVIEDSLALLRGVLKIRLETDGGTRETLAQFVPLQDALIEPSDNRTRKHLPGRFDHNKVSKIYGSQVRVDLATTTRQSLNFSQWTDCFDAAACEQSAG